MANLLKDFMHKKIIARAERDFYLRDTLIERGKLGRVLDVVADDTILLVDFGVPAWIVCRVPVYSHLISLHTLDAIARAERRRQWWRRLWPWRKRRRRYHYYTGE